MSSSTPPWSVVNYIGRPPETREAILADLRQQILDNRLPPGSRLPTRPQLVQFYKTGMTTIQQVIDILIEDAFIRARGKLGTFVVDYPPHRHRFGLVLAQEHYRGRNLSLFHSALGFQAEQWNEAATANRIVLINGANGDLKAAAFDKLCREINRNCFAGLIFAGPPYGLENTPLLDAGDLPRVVVCGSRPDFAAGRVEVDQQCWYEMAMEHVAGCGRRRLAIISASCPASDATDDKHAKLLHELARRHDIEIRPHWIQRIHPGDEYAAAQCARLLFSLPVHDCPEALLIADDHLVAGVDHGLQASSQARALDLSIIAWANFPTIAAVQTPMRFLGFDSGELLQQAMVQLLQLQTQPLPLGTCVHVQPVFSRCSANNG